MRIAIASGKGGTGKTTLSTNLAVFMAETEPVVVADLDVEEPNSGLFLRGELRHKEPKYKMIPGWVQNTCSLSGNCQAVCNFNAILKMGDSIMVFPELCHGCYACSELCPTSSLPMQPKQMGELKHLRSGRLDFVESRLMISEEQAVPLIHQTIDYVAANFPSDIIQIFDSPPGTSCPVIEAVRRADLVILVTEPTPFGLHDLKLAVETLRELGLPFAVAVNRSNSEQNRISKYCTKEDIPLLLQIPEDRRVAEAYSRGQTLIEVMPELSETLAELPARLEALI